MSGFLDSIADLLNDDTTARKLYGNLQMTSPRGGIRKADSVRKIGEKLVAHGTETLAYVSGLVSDTHRLSAVEIDLAKVEGHGQAYAWATSG